MIMLHHQSICEKNNTIEHYLYKKIALMLEELIEKTSLDKLDICEEKSHYFTTFFNCKKIPSISLTEYIKRIVYYTKANYSSLIISVIYLDQIIKEKGITINRRCIHRLILISIIISIKYNEDDYHSNKYYSKVGGISLEETNKLEIEFLKFIGFKLYVDEKEFEMYKKYIFAY